jgi:hypothetical protein
MLSSVLQITNTDQGILRFTARCLDRLGHSYVIGTPERTSAVKYVRVRGGLLAAFRRPHENIQPSLFST